MYYHFYSLYIHLNLNFGCIVFVDLQSGVGVSKFEKTQISFTGIEALYRDGIKASLTIDGIFYVIDPDFAYYF